MCHHGVMSTKHPLGSPQTQIPMCEKHSMNIDITCEDYDEFICSQCAKSDHKDHDWKQFPQQEVYGGQN